MEQPKSVMVMKMTGMLLLIEHVCKWGPSARATVSVDTLPLRKYLRRYGNRTGIVSCMMRTYCPGINVWRSMR